MRFPNRRGFFAQYLVATFTLLTLTGLPAAARAPGPPRILIYYSKTGKGHEYTAKEVRRAVLEEIPYAIVELKDVWDFASPIVRAMKEFTYPLILSHVPALRDLAYNRSMARGNEVEDLSEFDSYHSAFDKDDGLAHVRELDPDVVLSTNYSGAEILRALRQQGELMDRKLGWILTDYAIGYWPRVSAILDHTFLPHPSLIEDWIRLGVAREKVSVTGMPVDPKLQDPVDVIATRKRLGLNPHLKTILLTGGSMGQAPYSDIAYELFAQSQAPIQVIAVTGENEDEANELRILQTSLKRAGDRLVVTGRLEPADYLDTIKASDIYVSKAGGRAPTEGFFIQKPMVIFSAPGGGVEQGNLEFFEREGLAAIAREEEQIADQALALMANENQRKAMLVQQSKFREFTTSRPIVEFVLNSIPASARCERSLVQARAL